MYSIELRIIISQCASHGEVKKVFRNFYNKLQQEIFFPLVIYLPVSLESESNSKVSTCKHIFFLFWPLPVSLLLNYEFKKINQTHFVHFFSSDYYS